MDERLYWLGFSHFSGIGPKKLRLLLDTFTTVEQAWNADLLDVTAILGAALSQRFVNFRDNFNGEFHLERLQKKNIDLITIHDDTYPLLLKEVANAPFLLYVKGNKEALSSSGIGIVGTRKITQYGQNITKKITEELVREGMTIVSGLAYGVDAVAHATTVAYGGVTVAVLGCGVDCCYPRANQKLYDEILQTNGAIVSEFPMSMTPSVGSFPSRNRIIAGLSRAVVVTEGAVDSGALYTAEEAFVLGRKVFAVPGPITSSVSKGPLSLVEKGGILVTDVGDILQHLGRSKKRIGNDIKGDTKEEEEILSLLINEDLTFDEIVRKVGKASSDIAIVLSLMEMKGMIKNLASGLYSLS